MPRSSRHKSSKHSSRDARDYSDSDDDSSLKERRGNEETNARVLKDSGTSEKRKLDSKDGKDLYGSGNGEYSEDYGSSKRRKEKVSDGVIDRWNGGGDVDERGSDGSRKVKGVTESKSKRRDDEIEEVKKSGAKSEKHRESSRKEGKESERKGREGKGEKLIDNEEGRSSRREITTESKAETLVPESENLLEGRSRRRRDDSADWGKHQDEIGDKNRHAFSVDDASKEGRRKDEKQRDEKYRERYREELDRDNRNRFDKQKDESPAKDRGGSRSNDKYAKDEKESLESRHKKPKPHDGVREDDIDSARDHDRDRDRDRNRDHEHDGYRNRDRVRGGERDRNPARDKEKEREWEHDLERDRDHVHEWDVDIAHHDDRSIRYKDRRGRKRSPEDRDDYVDSKLLGGKPHNSDLERRSLSGSKIETDGRGRSQSRQSHADIAVSSNRRRASPTSSSHGGTDDHRHVRLDDLKYRDPTSDSRPKAAERGSGYRPLEKHSKVDDGHYVELTGERSSSSKASPLGLVERSPSSPSVERSRYMHRTGVRRSLDVEESGRRNSGPIDTRDMPVNEGRIGRDMTLEKLSLDDSSQADSSFYNRPIQGSSSIPPPLFRAGVESPTFMGMDEDSRSNPNTRFKRNDNNLGRGPVNNWRGVPNWSSPVPNGFMPFQHGPPHGNFQAMIPHFPTPPLFGVRPPMDISQSGIPYPIADADRFPGQLRPLGWPNMIDASGPPRLHGWDVNNGVLRNEPPIYSGSDWDHNRHPVNNRGWESSADLWKGHSSGANMDLPSTSHKESSSTPIPVDESPSGQGSQRSNHDYGHDSIEEKTAEMKASVMLAEKEKSKPSAEGTSDKRLSSKLSDGYCHRNLSRFYLSKLDISKELAHADVYKQCMKIMGVELNSTAEEDPIVRVILKDRRRAERRTSDGSLKGTLFPAMCDSVFLKAVDLYKKQRLETSDIAMSNGGLLDFVSSTNLSKMKKQYQVSRGDEVPAQAADEEMIQSPVSASDQTKENSLSCPVMEEKLMDLAPVSTEEAMERSPVSSQMSLGVTVQERLGYQREGPLGKTSDGEMDIMVTKQVIVDDERAADQILPCENASRAVDSSHADDGVQGVVVKTADDLVSKETRVFDNTVSDSLVVEGPSSTHEASMPGSNESELVNLSRIHHSPESTH